MKTARALSGKSFWVFRKSIGGVETARVSIDTYWDANEATAQYIVSLPDGTMRSLNAKAAVRIERAVYSGRIFFASVGNDTASHGTGRTVKAAVEDWASKGIERAIASAKAVGS